MPLDKGKPPSNQNDPVVPLGYIAPRDDFEAAKRNATDRRNGFFLSILIEAMAFIYFSLAAMHFGSPKTRPPHKTRDAMILPAILIALLAGITFIQHRRAKRYFVQGVLLSIGLAALLQGACFVASAFK